LQIQLLTQLLLGQEAQHTQEVIEIEAQTELTHLLLVLAFLQSPRQVVVVEVLEQML
jgi:hypothetical protein